MARQHLPIEPPLPVDLQQEIEASVDRFRAMFPVLIRGVAEEYVPKYRAEITTLTRNAWYSGCKEGFEAKRLEQL